MSETTADLKTPELNVVWDTHKEAEDLTAQALEYKSLIRNLDEKASSVEMGILIKVNEHRLRAQEGNNVTGYKTWVHIKDRVTALLRRSEDPSNKTVYGIDEWKDRDNTFKVNFHLKDGTTLILDEAKFNKQGVSVSLIWKDGTLTTVSLKGYQPRYSSVLNDLVGRHNLSKITAQPKADGPLLSREMEAHMKLQEQTLEVNHFDLYDKPVHSVDSKNRKLYFKYKPEEHKFNRKVTWAEQSDLDYNNPPVLRLEDFFYLFDSLTKEFPQESLKDESTNEKLASLAA